MQKFVARDMEASLGADPGGGGGAEAGWSMWTRA